MTAPHPPFVIKSQYEADMPLGLALLQLDAYKSRLRDAEKTLNQIQRDIYMLNREQVVAWIRDCLARIGEVPK